MTPSQTKTNYDAGRLLRRRNERLSKWVGGEALLSNQNYPESIGPQMKAYIAGYYDQDADLAAEMS